jgi:hypothetical protein
VFEVGVQQLGIGPFSFASRSSRRHRSSSHHLARVVVEFRFNLGRDQRFDVVPGVAVFVCPPGSGPDRVPEDKRCWRDIWGVASPVHRSVTTSGAELFCLRCIAAGTPRNGLDVPMGQLSRRGVLRKEPGPKCRKIYAVHRASSLGSSRGSCSSSVAGQRT